LRISIALMIKFLKKPLTAQMLYIEAILWLGIVRITILIFSFKSIARFLSKHMSCSQKQYESKTIEISKTIVSSILTMSIYMPWECKCLAQAITGKMMLKKRKISSTLYLGVAKDENGGLIAHAWLRVGEIIILGGGGLNRFAVVSTFT